MKFSFRRPLFIFLITGIIALAFILFYLNKPHRDAGNEAAIQTSPSGLYQSVYLNGEKKFLDKTVQLSGEIAEMQPGNEPVCVIEIPGVADASIRATFGNEQSGRLANFRQGDQISLKGICTGVLADTLMEGLISVDILIRDAIVAE